MVVDVREGLVGREDEDGEGASMMLEGRNRWVEKSVLGASGISYYGEKQSPKSTSIAAQSMILGISPS